MRVFFKSLRCFFFAMRLRRFLMTEPTIYLPEVCTRGVTGSAYRPFPILIRAAVDCCWSVLNRSGSRPCADTR
jgi:hypothetical protein